MSARSRESAALIAGWVRPMRAPARVTLRSAISASNATSKFRSMPCKSMAWMLAHPINRLQHGDDRAYLPVLAKKVRTND
jgi:hypothetical protein